MTVTELAELLEVSESYVYFFLNGERTPGLRSAAKLEQLAGIPAREWVSSELDNSSSASTPDGAKPRSNRV